MEFRRLLAEKENTENLTITGLAHTCYALVQQMVFDDKKIWENIHKAISEKFNQRTTIEESDIENICMIIVALQTGGKLT